MIREGGLRCRAVVKKSGPDKPLVSIVTVVLNGARHIESTIKSVLSQSYPNIEYLIIDGGSTDDTLDIIRKYEGAIDYWRSGPDQGLYDAMNKGISLANGDLIGILNADDVLYADSAERIVSEMGGHVDKNYTCGAVDLIDNTGKIYGRVVPFCKELKEARKYKEMPCPHLSIFVGRKVYERVGLFDTAFKLRADYDLLLRFMHQGVECVDLPFAVGAFRCGGRSGGMQTWLETRHVLKKNGAGVVATEYAFARSVFRSYAARLLPRWILPKIKRFMVSKNEYFS